MNYHTQYKRSPDADLATNLVEYVAKDIERGGMVVDRVGAVSEDRVEAFANAATREQMVRQHSAAFAEEHNVEALAEIGRDVAREHLEGHWLVGVHTSNSGNPHIHIAQAGSENQLWMEGQDIQEIRQDIADQVGEPYGGSL